MRNALRFSTPISFDISLIPGPTFEIGGCKGRIEAQFALTPLPVFCGSERVSTDFRIIALRWFLFERGRNEERRSPTAELPSSLFPAQPSTNSPPLHPSVRPSFRLLACCSTTSSPNLFCFLSLLCLSSFIHVWRPPPPPPSSVAARSCIAQPAVQ